MYNICEYCGSKIFEQDINCKQCGAPSPKIQNAIKEECVYGGVDNHLLFTYYRIPRLTNLDNKGNCVTMNQ